MFSSLLPFFFFPFSFRFVAHFLKKKSKPQTMCKGFLHFRLYKFGWSTRLLSSFIFLHSLFSPSTIIFHLCIYKMYTYLSVYMLYIYGYMKQQQQQQRAVIWQFLLHYVFSAGKCWNKHIPSVTEWGINTQACWWGCNQLSRMKMHAFQLEIFVFLFETHA